MPSPPSDKPDEPFSAAYILAVKGSEEYRRKPGPKPSLLARVFGLVSVTTGLSGGKYECLSAKAGDFDHSDIARVLEQLEEYRALQEENLARHISANARRAGFDYTSRVTAELWLGKACVLTGKDVPEKIRPGETFCLRDGEITPENIGKILRTLDTAESRLLDEMDMRVEILKALRPPENPKLMKPLSLKKKT